VTVSPDDWAAHTAWFVLGGAPKLNRARSRISRAILPQWENWVLISNVCPREQNVIPNVLAIGQCRSFHPIQWHDIPHTTSPHLHCGPGRCHRHSSYHCGVESIDSSKLPWFIAAQSSIYQSRITTSHPIYKDSVTPQENLHVSRRPRKYRAYQSNSKRAEHRPEATLLERTPNPSKHTCRDETQ
jgi:hypothetical protein